MNTRSAFRTKEGKESILVVYDSVLSGWPFPHKILNLETRYANTHVIACGDKTNPPLLLLHGSAFNSLMWLGDMAKYTENFMVYAIDIPGEPGKSGDVQYSLNGPVYSEWLDDVIKMLGLGKVSIAAISLGGWMALKYSVNNPEKVERLALLCPAGIGPQRLSFLFMSIPLMLAGKWGKDKLNRLINGNQPIPEEVQQYSTLIRKNFNMRTMVPTFSDEELRRITMPIAIFAGDKDVLLNSRKTSERSGELFPRAQIKIIQGAPHVLINLTDQVIEFLKNN